MEAPLTQWITKAKEGDKNAFGQLYELHVGKVYSLALRMLADPGHAEDATQELFIKVWHQLPSFRGDSQFSTWLHRIAINTVVDFSRRLKPVQPLGEIEPCAAQAPSDNLELSELEQGIWRLPEQARKVFVLFALEGYRHQEIAQLLGIAEGSSKAQYHRARQLLKEWICHD